MFWVIVDRLLRKRRKELLISGVLLVLAVGCLVWSLVNPSWGFGSSFLERVSFALLVAITVRWVTICFDESGGIALSSHVELLEAIASARSRVWISQTWLPGTEADAIRIAKSQADSIRLMLASHKPGSPINARIAGRRISVGDAKAFAARSVAPIVALQDGRWAIRFCFGHHPGWIAVIDSLVFWGPTPVDADNWANDFLFHRFRSRSEEGGFWEKQFETLWKDQHSHDYKVEKEHFNTSLP